MATVEYAGGTRVSAGRLKLVAEPGTILGPTWTREWLVATGPDEEGRTLCGYATTADIDAAVDRMNQGEAPRSVAEWSWQIKGRRQEIRAFMSVSAGTVR